MVTELLSTIQRRSCYKQWMPSRQALVQTRGTGNGRGFRRSSRSANNTRSCFWTPTVLDTFSSLFKYKSIIKNKRVKEKLQEEKGHIFFCLHNWNEAVSFVICPGSSGGVFFFYWMVVHNTKSILCRKHQHDSVNDPFIALCNGFKEHTIVSCTSRLFFSFILKWCRRDHF